MMSPISRKGGHPCRSAAPGPPYEQPCNRARLARRGSLRPDFDFTAGIATEANLVWLRAQGHHHGVVSRQCERRFDPALATSVQSAGDVTIKIQRVLDEQGHALLYCHSPAREQKDRAFDAAKTAGFEAMLVKLQAGLSKPRGAKDVATIMQRLGRAQQH